MWHDVPLFASQREHSQLWKLGQRIERVDGCNLVASNVESALGWKGVGGVEALVSVMV